MRGIEPPPRHQVQCILPPIAEANAAEQAARAAEALIPPSGPSPYADAIAVLVKQEIRATNALVNASNAAGAAAAAAGAAVREAEAQGILQPSEIAELRRQHTELVADSLVARNAAKAAMLPPWLKE